MQARCRSLDVDNDYFRGFTRSFRRNVIGRTGIQAFGNVRGPSGKEDVEQNKELETHWKAWGKRGVCDVTGQYTWHGIQCLVAQTLARDGEVLIRIVENWDKNPYGVAVQVLEADHLDFQKTHILRDGGSVRMGVEKDVWGAPVFYHVLTEHPLDQFLTGSFRNSERIPASELIHLFIPERPGQSRGMPPAVSAIRRIHMAGGMEEAELVAAREAASKMGFVEMPAGRVYTGDDMNEEDGSGVEYSEPGQWRDLPTGAKVHTYDPQHPNAQIDPFMKVVLRGAATGVEMSYSSFANDNERANFSSSKLSWLGEREVWRLVQDWLAGHLHQRVFDRWLANTLLRGVTKLVPSRAEEYRAVKWKPRGFGSLEPLKEVNTNKTKIATATGTREDAVTEEGTSFEEVADQLAKERRMLQERGLIPPDNAPAAESGADDSKPGNEGDSKPEDGTAEAQAVDAAENEGAALNGAQITAAVSVVKDLVAGQIPQEVALHLLIADGISADIAEIMVNAAVNFEPEDSGDDGSDQDGSDDQNGDRGLEAGSVRDLLVTVGVEVAEAEGMVEDLLTGDRNSNGAT